MRILFLAPCRGIAGGLRVIAAYGNLLARNGHSVTIAYPRPNVSARERLRRKMRRMISRDVDFFHGFAGRLLEVDDMHDVNLPPADIVIATAYETAYWAARLNVARERVIYLIQGIETWNADPERVFATYRLGFFNVAVSTFLSDAVSALTGSSDVPVLPNGCSFTPPCEDALDPVRKYDVGLVYSGLSHKNSAEGLEALRLVLSADPTRRAVVFGARRGARPVQLRRKARPANRRCARRRGDHRPPVVLCRGRESTGRDAWGSRVRRPGWGWRSGRPEPGTGIDHRGCRDRRAIAASPAAAPREAGRRRPWSPGRIRGEWLG